MSLYHETADIVSAPAGGNLKTRIFGKKDLKSPTQQVYALALETCKWSPVLKEVVENAELLKHERKLTPVLALLLVHDLLLSKRGIALPASHGLRTAVERHKARLTAELTRARLRRKAGSLELLRERVSADFAAAEAAAGGHYPRWVRVNTLKSSVEEQLASTLQSYRRAYTVRDVFAAGGPAYYLDEHVPNLLALSPGADITKTDAYANGDIVLQDKASCFPAYMLDPRPEDGDVMDTCAAPGNKTTHLAALVRERTAGDEAPVTVFACEKDANRSRTLEKMVRRAGAGSVVKMSFAQDFLALDPTDPRFSSVGALLLDPSCSGSGIVGREGVPALHLPSSSPSPSSSSSPGAAFKKPAGKKNKRKREPDDDAAASDGQKTKQPKPADKAKNEEEEEEQHPTILDDDETPIPLSSPAALTARLVSLSNFQLQLLCHALAFPAARRVSYSTCSVHGVENEGVVLRALAAPVAVARGWRVLRRDEQVRGLRAWDVRGDRDAAGGDDTVAQACVRAYPGDGRGVMGFFVVVLVRDGAGVNVPGLEGTTTDGEGEGPYVRGEDGRIVRDPITGMPELKEDGKRRLAVAEGKAARVVVERAVEEDDESGEEEDEEEEDEEEEEEESVDSGQSEADPDEWDGFED
ncbi:S-adenosyl-L-methionine-dependent methyltransferase [Xylariomycetidae sp. FL0641]|nr:S-adenosyl-L-methionine-dependent methyltransferase [Xylariomycetidae sp. FL0641]